jgi:uncharacterized membrane protein YcaP (DUF421 family)
MAKKIYRKMIYTEIRIVHKDLEEKQEYEKMLTESLKRNGYKNRNEFFRECVRNLNNK